MNNLKESSFYFVYMFLDNKETPLYIGITKSINRRIKNQHFSINTHLSNKCLVDTHKILIHKCESLDDMKIKERYLINDLKPIYNEKMNNNNMFSFDIKIDWELYPFNKKELIYKRNTRKIVKQEKEFKNHICEIKKEGSELFPVYYCEIEKITFLKMTIKYQGYNDIVKTTCYTLFINNELYVRAESYHYLFNEMYLNPINGKLLKYYKNNHFRYFMKMSSFLRVYNNEIANLKAIKPEHQYENNFHFGYNNDNVQYDYNDFIKLSAIEDLIDDEAINKMKKHLLVV